MIGIYFHLAKAEEISTNPNIKEQFETEPVKVIEKLIGIDLPDDIVMKVIDGVKAIMGLQHILFFHANRVRQ